jgi:hypothetical protein
MKMKYVVDEPRSGRPEVTYGPTIGPSGRSDINAVRQVGGLAVAR